MDSSELLFYGGIGVMIAAAAAIVLAAIIFAITGHRLRRKLEIEFGKK